MPHVSARDLREIDICLNLAMAFMSDQIQWGEIHKVGEPFARGTFERCKQMRRRLEKWNQKENTESM